MDKVEKNLQERKKKLKSLLVLHLSVSRWLCTPWRCRDNHGAVAGLGLRMGSGWARDGQEAAWLRALPQVLLPAWGNLELSQNLQKPPVFV